MTRAYPVLLAILLTPGLGMSADTYIVKRGDTLSHISLKKIGSPIMGPKGSLNKILELNPDIKDPNVILVEQQLRLPGSPQDPPVPPLPVEPPPPAESTVGAEGISAESPPPAPLEASNTETSPDSSKSHFVLGVAALLADTQVDIESDDGTLKAAPTSKLDAGAEISLGYEFASKSSIDVHVALLSTDFRESAGGRLGKYEKSLKEFGISYTHVVDRLRLSLGLRTEQLIFAYKEPTGTFAFQASFVDTFFGRGSFDLYSGEAVRWFAGAELAYHAKTEGSKVDVDPASGLTGFTGLAYSLSEANSLEGVYNLERRNQETSVAKQKVTESWLKLGIKHRF